MCSLPGPLPTSHPPSSSCIHSTLCFVSMSVGAYLLPLTPYSLIPFLPFLLFFLPLPILSLELFLDKLFLHLLIHPFQSDICSITLPKWLHWKSPPKCHIFTPPLAPCQQLDNGDHSSLVKALSPTRLHWQTALPFPFLISPTASWLSSPAPLPDTTYRHTWICSHCLYYLTPQLQQLFSEDNPEIYTLSDSFYCHLSFSLNYARAGLDHPPCFLLSCYTSCYSTWCGHSLRLAIQKQMSCTLPPNFSGRPTSCQKAGSLTSYRRAPTVYLALL